MAKFEDGCYGSLQGIALIAKVLAGRCQMHYTRVAAGKGTIPDDETPKTITEPPDYVMDAMISSVTNPVDGECQVSVQINSANVETGFYVTGLLLYAEDPDEGEIPFTYLSLENEPEWIRPASSIVGKLAHFDIIAAVGDVDTVTATIDPDTLVTLESVQQLISEHGRDTETHQDIRQAVKAMQDKLGGNILKAEKLNITIPAENWATDEDTDSPYSYRTDIVHTKIAEDMVPILTIAPSFLHTADDCGLCPTAQTLAGALRIYAKTVPNSEIETELTLLGDVRANDEIIIPTVGWVSIEDTTDEYSTYIDIANESITEELVPMLTIYVNSLVAAGNCGLCSTIKTMSGKLRIYAKSVPDKPIYARLALLGVSHDTYTSGTGNSYMLPVADSSTLGGVKVKSGSGLKIDGNGNLSVDAMTENDVKAIFNKSNTD